MPKLNYNLDEIDDFSALPSGRYRAKLIRCTQKKSKSSGQPMFEWEWKILTGKIKGRTAKTWTSLQPHALGSLKNHLVAFGLSGKVKNKSTDALLGKLAVLVVVETVSAREGHEGEPDSRVATVLPKDAPLIVESRDEDEAEEGDEDGDEYEDDDEEDDEDEEDEDEEDDEDEDDEDEEDDEEDEDEDEEEEEPPVKRRRKVKKSAPVKSSRRR